MSEAMTNSEIEDVLTSIRRLVSQEGQRPGGAPAPVSLTRNPGSRLVLTAAQRVDAAPELPTVPAPFIAAPSASAPTVTPDTADPAALSLPEPDFRALEATIAELEAAVSASGTGFEPDGTEAPTEPPVARSGATVTELYGKLGFVRRAVTARRHAAENAPETAAVPPLAPAPEPAQPEPMAAAVHQVSLDEDDEGDETFETLIDEEMLRAIVRELVHEVLDELLNERIRKRARWAVRQEMDRIRLDDLPD